MPSVYFIQLRLNYICNFYHCQAFSFNFFQNISITCRCRLPIQKQEVFPGEIFMRFSPGKRQKAEPKGSASCLLSVFTAGRLGQKHSRPAQLSARHGAPCFFLRKAPLYPPPAAQGFAPVNSRVRLLTRAAGASTNKESQEKGMPLASLFLIPSVLTAGHLGQKHSRPARLEHFAALLVSSCAKPRFFRPRRRRALRRLTAACGC